MLFLLLYVVITTMIIYVFLHEKYLIARAHFHRVPFYFLLVRRWVWERNGLRVSYFIQTFEPSFRIPLQ